jgi:hypothetical protein
MEPGVRNSESSAHMTTKPVIPAETTLFTLGSKPPATQAANDGRAQVLSPAVKDVANVKPAICGELSPNIKSEVNAGRASVPNAKEQSGGIGV